MSWIAFFSGVVKGTSAVKWQDMNERSRIDAELLVGWSVAVRLRDAWAVWKGDRADNPP